MIGLLHGIVFGKAVDLLIGSVDLLIIWNPASSVLGKSIKASQAAKLCP